MKTRRSISQGRLGSASSVIPTLSASAGRSATGLDSARLGPFGTGGWFWGSACTGAFSSPLLILLTPPIFWPLWDKGASFQSLTPAVSQRQPFASRDLRWIFFLFSVPPYDFFLAPFHSLLASRAGKKRLLLVENGEQSRPSPSSSSSQTL